ncbi:MAG: hypothetical protein CBC91_00645 [Rickettsiales bacterium TMED131]|nr:MAG: hypothetical protein CBC91_00645 [Rickettsiales bacterium TMED131]|tara:strand:- start:3999 stop:5399 length:1401 start_codon:yes stop_codon:yes gene_type:complete
MSDDSENEDFDLNTDHYTIDELLTLFSLKTNSSKEEVIKNTTTTIEYAKERSQMDLVHFYTKGQTKLYSYFNIANNEDDSTMGELDQMGENYNYNIISKPGPDYTSTPTDSRYELSYIQGDKNPVYKNTYNTLVNIDSSFRDITSESTSNFLSTLTYTLPNVIEYSVYTVEIPYSWFFFSNSYGNTVILVDDTTITLPDGNYTITQLLSALNDLLSINSFSLVLSLNTVNNYITIQNTGSVDYTITFYDLSNPVFLNSLSNVNLGWNLGFRTIRKKSIIVVSANSDTIADSTYYIYGPKYLLLRVNEFALNRSPSNLIGTMHKDKKCDYPSYLSRDLKRVQAGDNATSFQIIDPGLPKRLTKAKLYTINSILENRKTNSNPLKSSIDNSSDILIKIPIPNQEDIINSPNKVYSETSGFLSNFKRDFFGKINILKIKTQLLDDNGRVLNINNQDWSYTLLVKHIYQF